eukprot:7266151-Pyramimonas_sp.AAC.1
MREARPNVVPDCKGHRFARHGASCIASRFLGTGNLHYSTPRIPSSFDANLLWGVECTLAVIGTGGPIK